MYKKSFVVSTTLFMLLFLFDYIRTLFSIEESGEYYSFFGLRFTSTITPEEIETVFSLTPKIFYFYGGFVIASLIIAYLWSQYKLRK